MGMVYPQSINFSLLPQHPGRLHSPVEVLPTIEDGDSLSEYMALLVEAMTSESSVSVIYQPLPPKAAEAPQPPPPRGAPPSSFQPPPRPPEAAPPEFQSPPPPPLFQPPPRPEEPELSSSASKVFDGFLQRL